MPAKSKSQARLMYAVQNGSVKVPGLSKDEAHDFTAGMSKKRFSKLRERIGKK